MGGEGLETPKTFATKAWQQTRAASCATAPSDISWRVFIHESRGSGRCGGRCGLRTVSVSRKHRNRAITFNMRPNVAKLHFEYASLGLSCGS